MCYPCTRCNACGKFNEGSVFYVPQAEVVCFKCGGKVDTETGVCTSCGARAFTPMPKKDKTTR